jgi:hypothetical protein
MILAIEEQSEWSAHKIAFEIFKKFDSEFNLIISSTWYVNSDHNTAIKQWLNKDSRNKVIVISTFDPPWHEEKDENGYYIKDERVTMLTHRDVCFWLLAVNKYFAKYNVEQLSCTEFRNKFLCYQRKPWGYRRILYEHLKNKNGIITIGTELFSFNNIPFNTGHAEASQEFSTPNDIWTLGNINIWRESFLNIISETTQDPDKHIPFLSEKSFKPIIGMRPFICYSHPKVSEYLKNKGFETFDEEFGYKPTSNWEINKNQIGNIIDNLSNLDSFYKKLYPKILHNKNNFNQIVANEYKILDSIVEKHR